MRFFPRSFRKKFFSISLALIGPHAQSSSYYCGQWHWMFCLAKLKARVYLWRCVDWESRGVVFNREILGVEYLLSRSWVVKRQLLSIRHRCSYFIIPNHFIQVTYQTPKQNIPLSVGMSHTLWGGLGLGQNATVMFTRTPRRMSQWKSPLLIPQVSPPLCSFACVLQAQGVPPFPELPLLLLLHCNYLCCKLMFLLTVSSLKIGIFLYTFLYPHIQNSAW